MLRSLLAIILAVIVGMVAAKFVEGAGQMFFPAPGVDFADPASLRAGAGTIPFGYKAMLVAGWALGAFFAAALALLITRRWAPVGWLAAASMTLLAIISLAAAPFGALVWLCALIGTSAGGWAAVKLLRAGYAYPEAGQVKRPFP